MARPFKPRRIGRNPEITLYKPAGVPSRELHLTEIKLDELEAMRLVDGAGKDQSEAAALMGISRATVGRLLESVRRKTVNALIAGQGLVMVPGQAPLLDGSGCRRRGEGRGRRCRRKSQSGNNEESK